MNTYSPLPQSPVRVRYEDGDIALDYATPLARAEAIAAYNRAYARCITVRVGLGHSVDEAMLTWAHLAAHLIVGRDGESPFLTSAPEEPTPPAYVRLDGTPLVGPVITTARSDRDLRVARRYNLVYTRTIRHAVGQRVGLDVAELGDILTAAHRAAAQDWCPRCDGTGWTSFAPDGGCCYRCNPSGNRVRLHEQAREDGHSAAVEDEFSSDSTVGETSHLFEEPRSTDAIEVNP